MMAFFFFFLFFNVTSNNAKAEYFLMFSIRPYSIHFSDICFSSLAPVFIVTNLVVVSERKFTDKDANTLLK